MWELSISPAALPSQFLLTEEPAMYSRLVTTVTEEAITKMAH